MKLRDISKWFGDISKWFKENFSLQGAKGIVFIIGSLVFIFSVVLVISLFPLLLIPGWGYGKSFFASTPDAVTYDLFVEITKRFISLFAGALFLVTAYEVYRRLKEFLPQTRPDPKSFLSAFIVVVVAGTAAQLLLMKSAKMDNMIDVLYAGIVLGLSVASLLLVQRYPSRLIPVWIRFVDRENTSRGIPQLKERRKDRSIYILENGNLFPLWLEITLAPEKSGLFYVNVIEESGRLNISEYEPVIKIDKDKKPSTLLVKLNMSGRDDGNINRDKGNESEVASDKGRACKDNKNKEPIKIELHIEDETEREIIEYIELRPN